jgi:hypothetical protein
MILLVNFSGRKKFGNKLENFLEMDIFFCPEKCPKMKSTDGVL